MSSQGSGGPAKNGGGGDGGTGNPSGQPKVFDPVSIGNNNGPEVNGNANLDELEAFFETMKNEKQRLKTYSAANPWPVTFIKPEDLAKAGFFYLLDADRVQCAYCHGVIFGWEASDVPMLEHMRHYPRCPFVLNLNVTNGPVDRSVSPVPQPRVGRDVCGNHHTVNTRENCNSNKVYSLPINTNALESYGIHKHSGPKNGDYVSLDARLQSFNENWSGAGNLAPQNMAEAGFFHIRVDDYVKCFYCDGGLCHWQATDDPWVEHARWFPDCDFVLLNKGLAFVESCRQLYGEKLVNSTSKDDDALAVKAVEEWYTSPLVSQLVAGRQYDRDTIRATLHKRWMEKQVPFASLDELISSIEECAQSRKTNAVVSENREGESIGNSLSVGYRSADSSASTSPLPENSEKEERLMCKICFDRNVGVVFLPCGHIVACTQCAPGVTNCPMCRNGIIGVVRTYFS